MVCSRPPFARVGTSIVKHTLAASVVVAASVTFSVVLYFALRLWAIITSGGLGGPLALPGMMLATFVASSAAVIVILLPITVMAHAVCARAGKYHWSVEIIVSTRPVGRFGRCRDARD